MGGAVGKPIDLGTGRVAASFGHGEPSLVSLTTVVPQRGVAELTGAPPFDEAARGDPEATRAYRQALADDASACCWIEGRARRRCTDAVLDPTEPERPRWSGRLGDARLTASAQVLDEATIALRWELDGWTGPDPPVMRFAGRLGLPALAEITETNPPAATNAPTLLRARGDTLEVSAPSLGVKASLTVEGGAWVLDGAGAVARPFATADGRQSIVLRFRLDPDPGSPAPPRIASPAAARAEHDPITARALAYVRGCTALLVRLDERVLLTDHRLLPLSWTRDAYYQALLLLAGGAASDWRIVADHLRWLWRRCDRPDGRWARSHHADGRRKDLGFQADQQLYPILELADHWRFTGGLPDGLDWTDAVAAAWRAILAGVDPATGLLATEENAADDPAAAPFVGSVQILLWYAASRLAEVAEAGAIGLDAGELRGTSDGARAAFARHFATAGAWPYAVDARGLRVAYHDANDLPLALAPAWGFCATDDPGWRATLDFAWSSANPAFFPGERGGLGSVHTPHPWTLGDVQDWLIGYLTGDLRRRRQAERRLREVAFADGMLPEAYSAALDPDLRIRHWFAWPGAAYGALRLLADRAELERRLRAVSPSR